MTDVEFESFEITDQDLEDEFNPDRRRHFLSKNQQIYGIWAEEEEESKGSSRPNLSRKDYTVPINFVGGGIQQSGKKVEDEDNEDDDDESGSPEVSSNSSDEEGISRSKFPIKFGRNKMRNFKRTPGIAGIRRKEKEFGGWEEHTKGIGQKLLLQMGYQPGKGLGRDLQGIVTPIEAKQRKGRGALGLYGSEHVKSQVPVQEESEDDEPQIHQKLRHWKKKTEDGKKKVKYAYKTVEEVIAEGGTRRIQGDTSQLSKVKVIDLTGPEQRVFSGYHAIHQQHSKPSEQDDERPSKRFQNFALPELMHNLNLLLDMTEQEIVQNDRQLRHEQNLIVNLRHEEEKLGRITDQEQVQIQNLEQIMEIIDVLEIRTKEDAENPLTLTEAAEIFRRLQDEFYEDYKMMELAHLAVTTVFPLIRKYFSQWNPLQENKFGFEIMKEWKDILEGSNKPAYNAKDIDIYHRLIWEVWMPRIRQAVLEWNCRDCVPLIELLENWLPVIPPWVTENILTQLIFPRLQQEVENWNPLMDRMYIHVWIHPWLPLMGPRLETLYGPIRLKLANAMVNWHPSDDSARKILLPWVQVFPRGAMEGFVVKNILPKLMTCMQEFVINPHQQHLEAWHWVMAWEEFLPLPSLVSLLEKCFFPKWLHVLCSWLGHNPNYDEVSQWYMGWKSMFTERLLTHPTIKDHFNHALQIMNRAASLEYQPGAKEHFAYLTSLERQRDIDAQASRNFETISHPVRAISSTGNVQRAMRDLVERKADELGVVFMPVPNRYQEAKQVYYFGQLMVYLDRGVIFVQNETNLWVPTSLQSLADMAR